MSVASSMGFKRDDLRSMANDEIKSKVVEKRLGSDFKFDSEDGADPKFVAGVWSTIKADADKVRSNKQKHHDLHSNVSPHREDSEIAKPGNEEKDSELTYRQMSLARLDGVHNLNDEQLVERGFRN